MTIDLASRYLGLDLKNPFVPSSSPLSKKLDTAKQLEDHGAGALVMYSLFEEEIEEDEARAQRLTHHQDIGHAEASSFLPVHGEYPSHRDEYLEHLRRLKESLDIPVIASLNGTSLGGWVRHAKSIEEAGADALELNMYYIPTDPRMTGEDIERRYVEIVTAIRGATSLPLAVKMNPFFSATAHVAQQLVDAGANGLVLFNRFYQPDIDLEALEVVPHLVLSNSHELRLPLRWVAILSGRINADLAITTGIHTYEDVLKALLAGANVTMMASELLRNGIARISEILAEVTAWLEENEYDSVEQMRGSMSQRHVKEPSAFERANYMKVLQSWRPDPAGKRA